jgi:hypothetical protein
MKDGGAWMFKSHFYWPINGWETLMRLAALTIALFALPSVVFSKEPVLLGSTRADPAIIKNLSLVVVNTASGDCAQIDAIRIADIPTDFIPRDEVKTFRFELWTAIGCNAEFPVWVGWDRGGIIQISGKYRVK